MQHTNPTATAAPGAPTRRIAVATAVLYIAWLLLVDRRDPGEWVAGLGVALLCAWLAAPHLHLFDGLRLRPALPLHVLRFAALFLAELVKANLDMARRVLSPRLPIDPAIVTVQTDLYSPLGRLLLANAITLTPGTLTVDVEDNRIQVHWIDSHGHTDLEFATRAIAARFELYLKEILL